MSKMLQEIVVYSSSLRSDSLKLIRDFQVKKSRITDMATTLFKTQKRTEKYSDGRFIISTKKKSFLKYRYPNTGYQNLD